MISKDIYIAARFLTQPITGVQRFGIGLSKAIKKLSKNYDYNISFISPKNVIHKEIANFLEVKFVGSLKGQLWDQVSLLKFLKSKGNPLIVNFSNTLPGFYENKIVTIPDIIYLKYPVSYSYKKYYEIVFPLMIRFSRHIITISKFSKKEISACFGINEDKISVIYIGIDERFKPQKLKNHGMYILGVSSIAYHKNFIKLIEAFSYLKTKNVKLYIVGGVNEKIFGKDSTKILNYIKNNENIKFLGRVNDDTLIQLYSNALCFVYPSLYEGFGLPPLEAQACGCPVVISDIPVFREIYGDSALYFNPLDSQDIANKIEEMINNKYLRDILIKRGFENSKKYSWENSAKQFFSVLEKVIKND
jgi:glycosyltransferase involved in cell wall biosynthesis